MVPVIISVLRVNHFKSTVLKIASGFIIICCNQHLRAVVSGRGSDFPYLVLIHFKLRNRMRIEKIGNSIYTYMLSIILIPYKLAKPR